MKDIKVGRKKPWKRNKPKIHKAKLDLRKIKSMNRRMKKLTIKRTRARRSEDPREELRKKSKRL